MGTVSYKEKVQEAVRYLQEQFLPHIPDTLLILGSGLNEYVDSFSTYAQVPYADVPHMCTSTTEGHKGIFYLAQIEDRTVLVMQGRLHAYEGLTSQEICFPIYVAALLGVKTLITTNASGAINESFAAGEFGLITDHINLTGRNPLAVPHSELMGPRFPFLSEAYSQKYQSLALAAAREEGIALHPGVYISVLGPSFETPAEIRAFRILGADFVGMSTVEEVIAARQMDMEVCGITLLSNMACGAQSRRFPNQSLSVEEMTEIGQTAPRVFERLLNKLFVLMRE